MDALNVTRHEQARQYRPAAAWSAWTEREEVSDVVGRTGPEAVMDAGALSWEQILVGAGLDREARELSPAERWMADRMAQET